MASNFYAHCTHLFNTQQKRCPMIGHLFFDIRIYAYLTLNMPLFILSFIELIDLLL